jgi:transposase
MPKQSRTHYDTLIKVKIQGVHQFLCNHAISFNLKDIFKKFNVSNRTDYLIIKQFFSRTRHKSDISKTRDCKRKISEAQIDEANRILQDEDLQLKEKQYT